MTTLPLTDRRHSDRGEWSEARRAMHYAEVSLLAAALALATDLEGLELDPSSDLGALAAAADAYKRAEVAV